MKITINDLTFKCIVGILDFEREKKQKVIVNVSFHYTYKKDTFIDYAEISNLIKSIMKKKKFELLEEAIIYLEKKLYKMYNINNLQISISKPDILKDTVVSVSNY